VEAAPLAVGDVLALPDDGAPVLVERKTAGDLLMSIADGRLLDQAGAMRAVTDWSYLVVTEPMFPGRHGQVLYDRRVGSRVGGYSVDTQWTWEALQGALLTVQDLGVGVVWCGGDDRFERTVLWLAGRARGPVTLPRRDGVPLDDRLAVLGALPGVGPERARALLEKTGTVAWALQALTELRPDRGQEVAGIGPKTRANVRRVLGLHDGEALYPTYEDDDPGEVEEA